MSDDDLIRRGDALRVADEVFDKCENVHGDDRGAFSAAEVGARIAALPAVTVGVKPLVWKREADNAWVAAHYAIHQYWPHNNGPFAVSGYLGGLGAISLGKHPTLEAAKAAAQADYEARILAALAPTDAATQKGGDAHDRRLRSHEASPGVTAGADAAQAREAALMEAHKAILAMDTKKDEDLTYNLAVLRAAEKVRRLISEART